MKKNYLRAVLSFAVAGMMALSMFTAGTSTVKADDTSIAAPVLHDEPTAKNMYQTTGSETDGEIENILNGKTAYDGIDFKYAKSYKFSSQITVGKPFVIKTEQPVTINHGFSLNSGANLLFIGDAELTINGSTATSDVYGLVTYANNVFVTMDHAKVIIENTNHYGIYLQCNPSIDQLNVIGGSLTVKNCSNTISEGGIHIDGNELNVSDGAQLSAYDNASSSVSYGEGDIYCSGILTVSGQDTILSTNTTHGV